MFWAKIRSLVRSILKRNQIERGMTRELQFHLEARANDLMARGLNRDEAFRRARIEFGPVEKYKEEMRQSRGLRVFDELRGDLLYGLRSLRRTPGFTAVAAVSLALGIGANTLIFSLLDSTLLRPPAYPDPDRLAVIWTVPAQNPDQTSTSSVATYFAFRDQSRSFESVGAFNGGGCGIQSLGADQDGTPAERIYGQCFSPSLFELLGVKPVIGRTFTDAEDQVDNVAPVVLISYQLWQSRFGGDSGIIGKTFNLNRAPTTVIGVLPEDFDLFRDPNSPGTRRLELEFVLPLELTPTQVQSRVGGLTIVGRLRPGVSLEQARAEIAAIAAGLAANDPERHQGLGARVESFQQAAYRDYRSPLLILQGAVAFVLLIGCANVAGLLVARTASRRNEVALRIALGAGRRRIVRQLVTESLPLAVLGGALGVFLSWGGLGLFVATAPFDFPRLDRVSLDLRVLGFTALVVIATSVLFAVVPAIQASNVNLVDPLKESGRSATGSANRQRLRIVLVTGQIALALVLLIGAGLMIHSFVRVIESDLGADPTNLLTFDFRLTQNETIKPFGRYRGMGLWDISPVPALMFERVFERLQTVPGVLSVAAVNVPPFEGEQMVMPFFIEGRPVLPSPGTAGAATVEGQQTASYRAVTGGFFAAMRIPLLRGRDFNDRDTTDAPLVTIINETMARQFFPNGDPIGKRVILDWVPDERPREIIAVVGDTATAPLQRRQPATLYVPHVQQTSRFTGPSWWLRSGMYFALRTPGNPMNLVPAVKRAVAEVDPNTPVAEVRTVEQSLDNQVRNLRLYMLLLGIFGAVAAVLAATGIYGVMAYSIVDRTREIGIRRALGGQTQDVLMMVFRQAAWLIGIGLVLGLAGSFALTRLIQSQLFGVTPADPVTYAASSLLLLLIAVVACLIPARRAIAVDPIVTLKYE
ncbi:MAG: ABC transporter permease [Acidobacteria bacterium]|nr:ABC transporter permease [Acidobacteriota bacterium]